MVSMRTSRFSAVRLVLSALVLVGVAAAAQASPLTLNFSGILTSASDPSYPVDSTFSGFFTWDTNKTPLPGSDANFGEYELEAYQLIFNGEDKTVYGLSRLIVVNDADPGTGSSVDALIFLAGLEDRGPVTGEVLFVGLLSGPTDTWNSTALPTSYSFLSSLTTALSIISLEVPGQGDDNDIVLAHGRFAANQAPEPTTLTLTALGLAGVIARAMRGRQRRS